MHHAYSPLQHVGSSLRPLQCGRSSQPRLLSFFQAVQDYKTVCHRTINKTNVDGGICTSYGWDHIEGHHDSTPWIWLHHHVAVQAYTYTINLPTDSEFSARV